MEHREAELREEPFIWATWLTKLISGEAKCEWSLWFRARHYYQKLESGTSLEGWTKEHDALVEWRANKLREAGLKPRIEQSFTVNGRSATVKGKADIVYEADGVTWIEECKTGKRRDADHVQAILYMWFAELNGARVTQARVVYKDEIVDVSRTRMPAVREAALRLVALSTQQNPPPRNPSQLECRSCNVGHFYCKDRVTSEDEIFVTDAF